MIKDSTTPIRILNNEQEYSINDFKRDLRKELGDGLTNTEEGSVDKELYLNIVYITCFFLATNKSLLDIAEYFNSKIPNKSLKKKSFSDMGLLEEIKRQQQDNIEILRATLLKQSIKYLDSGMTIEKAKQAIEQDVGIF